MDRKRGYCAVFREPEVYRNGILKLLGSPGIDSKESIPLA
jgi:hypothetical protein